MHPQRATLTAVAIVLALSACSNGSTGTPTTTPDTGALQGRGLSEIARSGIAPKFLGLAGRARRAARPGRPAAGTPRTLYVDDWSIGAVELLKARTYVNLGGITSGINGPDGNWVDASGNLYVANYAGPNVTEYNSTGAPVFTYDTGMTDAVDVTTDGSGNVYEADYNYPNFNGFVNEYAQQSDTVAATCYPGGAVESVAVDRRGDVFVAYNNTQTNGANIVEYRHGLAGCNGTVLPMTLAFAGGMVVDKAGNLLVCDQVGGVVDVIAAPYAVITSTLGSGFSDPLHVTVDRANNTAYVAEQGNSDVRVLSYPRGSNLATLGSANGLENPSGAVDSKNYVP